MTKYALVLSFDGTRYCGWQNQKNAVSVQTTVQDALEKVFGNRPGLSGCSRTDSGVHANEYVCHFSEREFDVKRLPLALNTYLPDDIAVLRAYTVEDDFHSRYSALGKEYVYLIRNSGIKSPFMYSRSYQYVKNIDVELLNEILGGFVGKHDFRSYMAAHSKILDTVREIYYCYAKRESDYVKIYIAADGFLYNMVRIIVGTALGVLTGSVKATVEEITEKRDRAAAGHTAPALGLYLNRVFYSQDEIKERLKNE